MNSLNSLPPRSQMIALTALASLGIGSSIVALSVGIRDVDPLSLVAIRLLVAVIGFLIIARITGRVMPQSRGSLRDIAILGVIDAGFTTVLFVSALQYMTAAFTTLIATLIPLITAIMATFWLKQEEFGWLRLAGLLLGLSGVAVLIFSGAGGLEEGAAVDPRGPLQALLASLFAALAFVFTRQRLSDVDPIMVAGGQMTTGFILVGALAFLFSDTGFGSVAPQSIAAVIYSGVVGSLLGIVTIYVMIQRFGATAASYPIYFTPFVAATLGVLLLDQQITLALVVGGLIVLLGVYLANRPKRGL